MDEFDGSGIIVSILVSCLGFVLFSYGRKMSRAPQALGGLILMVFPYFVSSVGGMLLIAALLVGAIWVALKFGW